MTYFEDLFLCFIFLSIKKNLFSISRSFSCVDYRIHPNGHNSHEFCGESFDRKTMQPIEIVFCLFILQQSAHRGEITEQPTRLSRWWMRHYQHIGLASLAGSAILVCIIVMILLPIFLRESSNGKKKEIITPFKLNHSFDERFRELFDCSKSVAFIFSTNENIINW